LLQLLQERTDASLIFRIIRGCSLDDADRRTRSACCARATSGQPAAAPLSSVAKNFRRLMWLAM